MITRRLFGSVVGDFGEVLRGASWGAAIKCIAALIDFALTIVVARQLGSAGAGIYFLLMHAVTLGSVVGRWGVDSVMLRSISVLLAKGHVTEARNSYSAGVALVLLTAGIVSFMAIAIVVVVGAFEREPRDAIIHYGIYFSVLIVPVSLLYVYSEVLRAQKLILISQILPTIISSVCVIAALLLFQVEDGLFSAYLAVLAGTVLALILGYRAVTQGLGDLIRPEFGMVKRLSAEGRPFLIISLIATLISVLPTFSLATWGSDAEVGVLSVALRTAIAVNFVLLVFNIVLAPKIGELMAKSRISDVESLLRRSASWMVMISAPIFGVLFVWPAEVMAIFGQQYSEQGQVLSVIAVGQLVNVMAGSVGYLLIMAGREDLVRKASGWSLIICLLTSAVLVPLYRIWGAAIASSLSLIATNVLMAFWAKRELGVRCWSPWLTGGRV